MKRFLVWLIVMVAVGVSLTAFSGYQSDLHRSTKLALLHELSEMQRVYNRDRMNKTPYNDMQLASTAGLANMSIQGLEQFRDDLRSFIKILERESITYPPLLPHHFLEEYPEPPVDPLKEEPSLTNHLEVSRFETYQRKFLYHQQTRRGTGLFSELGYMRRILSKYSS